MRSTIRPPLHARRATLVSALALIAISSGCSSSSSTQPPADWATITLISGANQTVTVNPSGLTDLPQLVVVRVDSLGTPLAAGDVRVRVWMNGAPGPNGPYSFITGADGVAAMQLQVSNILGPVSVNADYVRCTRWGFFACEQTEMLATVIVPGVVAQ
jgi:hypothetical protein